MSIQTQIDRISGNVSAALAAIAEKGVTVPDGSNSDALAELIASIEAGGGNNEIKIDSGTFTPAEDVSEYAVEQSVQMDNVVIHALIPNLDGYGLTVAPINTAGYYIGYNIPGVGNRQIQAYFDGASHGGVDLYKPGNYAHIERQSYNRISSPPLNLPYGKGLNESYFKFCAGVEYLWFKIGY